MFNEVNWGFAGRLEGFRLSYEGALVISYCKFCMPDIVVVGLGGNKNC